MTDDERLVGCFRQIFPTLSDAEIRDASMRRLGTWDSAALLMLLARVEREFQVRFSQDQINTFTSFTSVLDLVRTASSRESSSRAV